MKIRKDDKVTIISGKDRGKTGKVLKVFLQNGKVLVEGINMVKRHVKPGTISKDGGIVSIEKPLDASNVMYFSEEAKRPVRLGYKIVDNKKKRYCKKTGKIIDK